MQKKVCNKLLEFYEKHDMSPGNKELEEWSVFKRKRTNLYRQLGVPVQCFKEKNILEFGPGSGHNALAIMMDFSENINFGEGHIDLVEPNLSGRNDIKRIFENKKIPKECYTLYSDVLEDFVTNRKYDFVIAEQFLPYIENWKECVEIIKNYTTRNGIVIITCADAIGLYVELTKRLVGQYIVRDIESFSEKVDRLIKIFEPQLIKLKGMNRTCKEWVQEEIFNGASLCTHPMNMNDAIDAFGNEFDILGTSQRIFTDYSWYKDLDYDYVMAYKKQYNQKKHMFLLSDMREETIRTEEENASLEQAVITANELTEKFEKRKSLDITAYKKAIDKVTECSDNQTIKKFNEETLEILKLAEKSVPDVKIYDVWSSCFGRTSQYISFIRKERE